MSYNGIGLQTARGSGTNGFVQRNLSYLKNKQVQRKDISNYSQAPQQAVKAANKEILDHEKKRKVEIKCMELADELLEQGLDQEAIDEKVASMRTDLLNNLEKRDKNETKMKDWQTHQRAEAKERDNQRFGEALGIRKGYEPGSSFSGKVIQFSNGRKSVGIATKRNGPAEGHLQVLLIDHIPDLPGG
jgi:serine/arginine repetitive matrix protein 2